MSTNKESIYSIPPSSPGPLKSVVVRVTSSANVSVYQVDDCGDKGETHWFWSVESFESGCFPTFAEAAQDSQRSFDQMVEKWMRS